jgi:RNA recognition motif-containing protein
MTKLHVGNLSADVTNDTLRLLFTDRGFLVMAARVICDREGGRSRGFGFVEFDTSKTADDALSELNGLDVSGRALQIKHARPQEPRDGRADAARSRAAADARRG